MKPARERNPKVRLARRVAHRPAYRAMVARVVRSDGRRRRWESVLAYGGFVGKGVFYAALFFWAARSPVGAGALQGAVAADILTFLFIGGLRLLTDGFELTMDGIFEAVLLLAFLNRGPLFDIETEVMSAAAAFLAFLLFVPIRVSLWGIDELVSD